MHYRIFYSLIIRAFRSTKFSGKFIVFYLNRIREKIKLFTISINIILGSPLSCFLFFFLRAWSCFLLFLRELENVLSTTIFPREITRIEMPLEYSELVVPQLGHYDARLLRLHFILLQAHFSLVPTQPLQLILLLNLLVELLHFEHVMLYFIVSFP